MTQAAPTLAPAYGSDWENQMLEQYAGLVRSICWKIYNRKIQNNRYYCEIIELDDLLQEGRLGLWHCLQKYKGEFQPFAGACIRNAVNAFLGEKHPLARSRRDFHAQVNAIFNDLQKDDLDLSPQDPDIVPTIEKILVEIEGRTEKLAETRTRVTPENIREALDFSFNLASLDELVENTSTSRETGTFIDSIKSLQLHDTPAEVFERRQLSEDTIRCIAEFCNDTHKQATPEQARDFFKMHYLQDMPGGQIWQTVGKDKNWPTQMKKLFKLYVANTYGQITGADHPTFSL